MDTTRSWRTTLVASVLFLCSGALGLGYELVWIREAALVVGASQIALSTVVSAFFLGIALGSTWVGRRKGSARRSSLFVYGLFELGIGAFALAFPLLFRGLEAIYAAAYPTFSGSAAGLFGLRFALIFLLFVPPTFLMGGTLPLLLDGLAGSGRRIGARASSLYGINIAGAVVGVLATSYLAIPWIGMSGTSFAGGVLNLALGAVAVALFRSTPAEARETGRVRVDPMLCALAFGSGLVALGYQIAWARYFSLIQFSTVYLTAVLLAVFLAALATGSFALAPVLRIGGNPLRIAGVAQCLAPIAALACLRAWRFAEYRTAVRREWVDGQSVASPTLEIAVDFPRFWRFFNETADATFFAPVFQVVLTLFLPVALLGMGLPALIAAAAQRPEQIRAASGRLVFWNTLGASAGSFLAGYVLLPLVGLHGTLAILGVAMTVLGALAFWRATPSGAAPRARGLSLGFAAACAGVVIVMMATRADVTWETVGERQFGRNTSGVRLVDHIEGPTTTSWVFEDDLSLRIGSGAVQMAQVVKKAVSLRTIEGHLPALLYPGPEEPRDCLGICIGSGQSFGALLRYPLRRLDVVDISGEITTLALRSLARFNNGLSSDPRVAVHLDDGRHFVARAAAGSYDLVSMESAPPIIDGAHSLYTLEFYRDIRRVLRPGGVFMQYMPLHYLTPSDVRCVLRTLAEVFPETLVLRVTPGDFMLLAYPNAPRFPRSALRRRIEAFEREWTERGIPLDRWSPESSSPIASIDGIFSMIVTGAQDVRRIAAPYELRDDRPLLSYGTGDRWLTRRYVGPTLMPISFAALPRTPFDALRGLVDPPLSDEEVETLTADRVVALQTFHIPYPHEIERKNLAFELAGSTGERVDRALDLALMYDAQLDKESAFRAVEQGLQALAAGRGQPRPEQLETARGIVRNRVAVYAGVCATWIERFESEFAGSALVAAMRAELAAHQAREAEFARGYLAQ